MRTLLFAPVSSAGEEQITGLQVQVDESLYADVVPGEPVEVDVAEVEASGHKVHHGVVVEEMIDLVSVSDQNDGDHQAEDVT